MNVTVTKTITEHTNGRRKHPASPTGWEERTGVERVVGDRGKPRQVTIWEPCSAPLGPLVYGSEEHRASGLRGGTIHTQIEGVESGAYHLTAGEAESILRKHARDYATGMSIFHGGVHLGDKYEMKPHEGHAMAQWARDRVMALFGLDLADTNVAANHPAPSADPS